ncbi:unnamed protein product [Pedinophyceae sp. YPF-701]|nr:unnamed protein product [Pedinophyceae sp. YPF-701]
MAPLERASSAAEPFASLSHSEAGGGHIRGHSILSPGTSSREGWGRRTSDTTDAPADGLADQPSRRGSHRLMHATSSSWSQPPARPVGLSPEELPRHSSGIPRPLSARNSGRLDPHRAEQDHRHAGPFTLDDIANGNLHITPHQSTRSSIASRDAPQHQRLSEGVGMPHGGPPRHHHARQESIGGLGPVPEGSGTENASANGSGKVNGDAGGDLGRASDYSYVRASLESWTAVPPDAAPLAQRTASDGVDRGDGSRAAAPRDVHAQMRVAPGLSTQPYGAVLPDARGGSIAAAPDVATTLAALYQRLQELRVVEGAAARRHAAPGAQTGPTQGDEDEDVRDIGRAISDALARHAAVPLQPAGSAAQGADAGESLGAQLEILGVETTATDYRSLLTSAAGRELAAYGRVATLEDEDWRRAADSAQQVRRSPVRDVEGALLARVERSALMSSLAELQGAVGNVTAHLPGGRLGAAAAGAAADAPPADPEFYTVGRSAQAALRGDRSMAAHPISRLTQEGPDVSRLGGVPPAGSRTEPPRARKGLDDSIIDDCNDFEEALKRVAASAGCTRPPAARAPPPPATVPAAARPAPPPPYARPPPGWLPPPTYDERPTFNPYLAPDVPSQTTRQVYHATEDHRAHLRATPGAARWAPPEYFSTPWDAVAGVDNRVEGRTTSGVVPPYDALPPKTFPGTQAHMPAAANLARSYLSDEYARQWPG